LADLEETLACSARGPLVAHCHLGLTQLCRRTGDHAKAEEHLAVATTMCREMGVNSWVDDVEAGPAPPHGGSL
jgi:hypothetical protein